MDGLDPGTRVLRLFLVNERGGVERDRDAQFVFQVRMQLTYARGFVSRPNRRGEDANDEDQRVFALAFPREPRVGRRPQHVRRARGRGRRQGHGPAHDAAPVLRGPPRRSSRRRGRDDGHGRSREARRQGHRERALADRRGVRHMDRRAAPARRSTEHRSRPRATTRDGQGDEGEGADREGHRAPAGRPGGAARFQSRQPGDACRCPEADKTREDPRYVGGKQPSGGPSSSRSVLLNPPVARGRDAATIAGSRSSSAFPTGGGKTEGPTSGSSRSCSSFDGGCAAGARRTRAGAWPSSSATRCGSSRSTSSGARRRSCARSEGAPQHGAEGARQREAHRGTLGGREREREPPEGRARGALRLHARPDRLALPADELPMVWRGDQDPGHQARRRGRGSPRRSTSRAPRSTATSRDCRFTEAKAPGLGLPVIFVDEQIYRELPCFVVATVDKFAMLPWLGEAGMLFGRATHVDDRRAYGVMHDAPKGARPLPDGLLPPELIIQDELHLISGPLGTMVGLYEAAVDYLCERPPRRAAARPRRSAARPPRSRRRAPQRDPRRSLGRSDEPFPPRGIVGGRDFLRRGSSVSGTGPAVCRRGAPRVVRCAAPFVALVPRTLLAAARSYSTKGGEPNQDRRPVHVPRRLLQQPARARRHAAPRRRRGVATAPRHRRSRRRPRLFVGAHRRAHRNRKHRGGPPSSPAARKPPRREGREAPARSGAHAQPTPGRSTCVLAWNVFSVGLDVDRLGLMVVAGQPKTSASTFRRRAARSAARTTGARGHLPSNVMRAARPLEPLRARFVSLPRELPRGSRRRA